MIIFMNHFILHMSVNIISQGYKMLPPLKRTVHLLCKLKVASNAMPTAFMDRVKLAMKSGGIGTENNFSMNSELLSFCLVLNGLPPPIQIYVLKKFSSWNCLRGIIKIFGYFKSVTGFFRQQQC